MHTKLHVHNTVMVGANLHHLFYNCANFHCFSLHILLSVNYYILLSVILNTKGLVTLTEYQQMS